MSESSSELRTATLELRLSVGDQVSLSLTTTVPDVDANNLPLNELLADIRKRLCVSDAAPAETDGQEAAWQEAQLAMFLSGINKNLEEVLRVLLAAPRTKEDLVRALGSQTGRTLGGIMRGFTGRAGWVRRPNPIRKERRVIAPGRREEVYFLEPSFARALQDHATWGGRKE